ncbi:hypothetical protein NIES4075_67900 [Tolypothrix sp. NIES-4075]|uniref:hypothetical protein n=1 Tax=Tolypothrix sp. NIES-4075 TaxID=2005459 RepID=UPI000B5C7376|nr:hypothetical protein [Tolypothrix sp. NIES-4075]GAX45769.1 hypothetical protein NIES4075_67900 [Tolypothrix sp. NIES-4075]
MRVSSELQSQSFNLNQIHAILIRLGRMKWEYQYNKFDLEFEPWAIGVWVKQAGTIISYKDLAEYLREESELKAYQLPVTKAFDGWLVKSSQGGDRYYVRFNKESGWCCNCMLFRCRYNRTSKELPQLWEAMNKKAFCHHIVAVYSEIK